MNNYNIVDIFGDSKFQTLQDNLAISTGLAIIVVNYLGEPITEHSERTKFCSMIRSDSNYCELCTRCDSRGGLEAARIKKPYLYKCHSDIIDFAIPIVYNDYYLGALMAGQVLLDDHSGNSHYPLEQIYKSENLSPMRNKEFFKAYQQIPKMSFRKLIAASNMLYTVSNIYLENKIRNLQSSTSVPVFAESKKGEDPAPNKDSGNNILQPVYDYIEDNISSDLSLNKVAAECGISPSYLSRVFSRESDSSFIQYVNKKKIERAKQLLMSSDMPIYEIAASLDFNDASYFIKVFKRYENTSPAKYRAEKMQNMPPHGIDLLDD